MGGLTDRQREALVTAYRHGYFDRDREHNATEIADRLGISRWTFSEHLRVAQGKLLERLLD
jgi:predicted DNA binding protein